MFQQILSLLFGYRVDITNIAAVSYEPVGGSTVIYYIDEFESQISTKIYWLKRNLTEKQFAISTTSPDGKMSEILFEIEANSAL